LSVDHPDMSAAHQNKAVCFSIDLSGVVAVVENCRNEGGNGFSKCYKFDLISLKDLRSRCIGCQWS
jgi:hypothetical protein